MISPLKWKLYLYIATAIVLLGTGGWLAWDRQELKLQLAEAKKEKAEALSRYQEIRSEHADLVASAAQDALEWKNELERLKHEAQQAREGELQANRERRAAIESVNRRLLDDKARSTLVTGDTTEDRDTVTAARARAETLWVLLQEAVSIAEEASSGAEQAGTDLRTVLAAWPRTIVSITTYQNYVNFTNPLEPSTDVALGGGTSKRSAGSDLHGWHEASSVYVGEANASSARRRLELSGREVP